MGVDALFLTTAAVAFTFALYRALTARGGRHPALVPQITIALALGVALVSLAPAVQAVENSLIPSLGRLISNVCTVVAAFAALHLMLYVVHPPEQVSARVPPRLALLLAAIGLMLVMFALSDPPTGLGLFTGLYRSQPTLAVYVLTQSVYLGVALVDLAHLAVLTLRPSRRWLRAGMILTLVGCLLAAAYLADKIAAVFSELISGRAAEGYCPSAFATLSCTLQVGFPALAVLTLLIGTALPSLGPRLERLFRTAADRRAYRRLEPLWRTLRDALPETAGGPDSLIADQPATTSEQLYRRVVAIRDALLVLQHPTTSAPADSRDSDRAARTVRAALQRAPQPPPVADGASPVKALPQLRAEIRWLTLVTDELSQMDRKDR